MSSYERNKGTLTPVPFKDGQTLKQKVRELCIAEGADPSYIDKELQEDYYGNEPVELLCEVLYAKAGYGNKVPYSYIWDEWSETLYKQVLTVDETENIEFTDVTKEDTGVIHFHALYYNGGVGLSELLEDYFTANRTQDKENE